MPLNNPIQATLLATILLSATGAAQALTFEPFTEARFRTLQAENKPILIDINAKWCSTCKAQGWYSIRTNDNTPTAASPP